MAMHKYRETGKQRQAYKERKIIDHEWSALWLNNTKSTVVISLCMLVSDPEWGSCSVGVFICLSCSGVHRNITNISKVKSLRLSHWEDLEVQFMSERGNEVMKAVYEANVPVYYYKPTHKDCAVLKEQWIRAKYDRQEFMENSGKPVYEDGIDQRWYTDEEGAGQRTVSQQTIRSFSEGWHAQEIVDWFNSIRAVQLHYLQVAFPGASDTELKTKLTRNFLKEGYMEKTGPRDAFAKGEVFLGYRDHGYSVAAGLPAGTHCNGSWQQGITIQTPDRSYLFTCQSEAEQKEWMSVFNTLINTPMSPREYTEVVTVRSHRPVRDKLTDTFAPTRERERAADTTHSISEKPGLD
ncbi:hypothetical protein DNTS_022010 [Danionella cerebrum]|uniref:Arf-GAP domain-containing protein n=1 Tax=Danionella cerebrum TaxID=2873325 RepID=A0A553RGN0_9TELE|nr:hypothetical protein DNTS_022010 [Danionella translucida]